MLALGVIGALTDANAAVGTISVTIGIKSHLNRLRIFTEFCCTNFSFYWVLFGDLLLFQPTGLILDCFSRD